MKIKEKESKKEKNPKIVWLIEDNVAYASSLKRIADIFGVKILHFTSGEELLEKIEKEKLELPSLILVDGDLGPENKKGWEIIQEIKNLGIKAKIIGQSANKEFNEKMLEYGADEVIEKVTDLKRLFKIFEDIQES